MLLALNWAYSALYTLLLLFYLPFFLYRVLAEGKSLSSLLKRLGPTPRRMNHVGEGETLWLHAVSVGEVKAIQPLVEELDLPEERLFISTITETGQKLARTLFRGRAQVFYLPLDWQWICRLYLRSLRPSCLILAETEIWPGLLSAAQSAAVPVLVVNGRISDHSFRRYRRIRPLLAPFLSSVAHFCVQTRRDKERVLELGALPSRVNQTGNLKYDYQLPELPEKAELVKRVEELLKPTPEDLLWVCGSTREGEEEVLLAAFQSLSKEFPSLRLLLAPRHPHRSDGVGRLVRNQHLEYLLRSDLNSHALPAPRVLLLDTIGELAHLYQLADVVFVGGSLFPTGGHNIIEVAYFGKPILFGPHMENFREICSTFLDSYAALQIQNQEELVEKTRELLRDPASRRWLGQNARKVIRDNRGAVGRTAEIVRQYLEKA